MKFGLIGGVGPQATVPYYLGIVNGVQKAVGRPYFPRLTIESLSCFDVIALSGAGRFNELTDYLLSGLRSLADAGADYAALSCITGHVVFPQLARRSPLPLLSILTPLCRSLQSQNAVKIGLLGTEATMRSEYFAQTFATAGIESVIPPRDDADWVARIIPEELEYGRVTPQTTDRFKRICDDFRRRGCDAVVLGCTELPLVFSGFAAPLPAVDPIPLHIDAVVHLIASDLPPPEKPQA